MLMRKLMFVAFLSALSVDIIGCSGGANNQAVAPPQPTITSISAVCNPSTILSTGTSVCAATVQGTGSFSSAITWTATGGSITSAGTFTPSGAGTAVITATSVQDLTKTGSTTISVSAAPTVSSVSISCAAGQVPTSQSTQCSAIVSGTGSYSTSVTWAVNGTVGGTSVVGTISPAGLYMAPAAVPTPYTVTIGAVSAADATKSSSTTVIVAGTIASSSQFISAASGGTITLSDGSSVTIPPAMLGSDTTATLTEVSYAPDKPGNPAVSLVGPALVLSFQSPISVHAVGSPVGRIRPYGALPQAVLASLHFVSNFKNNAVIGLNGALTMSEIALQDGTNYFLGAVGTVDTVGQQSLADVSSDVVGLETKATNGVVKIVFTAANWAPAIVHTFHGNSLLSLSSLSASATWGPYSTCPTGKTLLVVHGMLSSVEYSAFPATDGTIQKIASAGRYQSVIGFDYDWTQAITDSGTELASFIDELFTTCSGFSPIDIEAHSEGVAVTLSALTHPSVRQNVGHFVALGGPIMGTPMANDARYLAGFFAADSEADLPLNWATSGLAILFSQPFVANLQVSTSGSGDILDQIRSSLAAAPDNPPIFVIAGDTPESLNITAKFIGIPSDGFIPVSSALAFQTPANSAVLKVYPFPPFQTNHLNLTSDTANIIPDVGVLAKGGFAVANLNIAANGCNAGLVCLAGPGSTFTFTGSGYSGSQATEYSMSADTEPSPGSRNPTFSPSSNGVLSSGWQDVTTCATLPQTRMRFAEVGNNNAPWIGAPSNAVFEQVASGSCTTPAITISITPPSASIGPGGSQRFTAVVSDGSSVLWSIQEGSSGGLVDNTGLYAAPATPGTYHVIATSVSYPTISASVPVSVITGSVPVAGSAMLKMNPERTNRATVAGPSNLPIFTSVVTGVTGALRRVGADGTLITTSTGTCAPAGSCQVVTAYTASGSTKWTRSLVLQDGQGFSDVAIAPSGVVYVTSYYGANVYALDGATGSVLWTTSTNSTGTNESGDLMIDPSGTIYFETSTSVVGPTNQLTAISPNGTIKWSQAISTRAYNYAALSNDNQLLYIPASQGSPYNYPQVDALSTIDGTTQYFNTCYMTTVDVVDGMTVFGELTNSHLAAATGQLSTCTDLQSNGSAPAFDSFEALTPNGVLVASTNYVPSGFSEGGSTIWNGSQQMGGGFSDSSGTLFEIVFTPGTASSTVEALNGNTGVLSWQYTFPAAVFSGATVAPAPNTIQIGPDGSLYVLAGQTIYRGKP